MLREADFHIVAAHPGGRRPPALDLTPVEKSHETTGALEGDIVVANPMVYPGAARKYIC